MSLHSVYNIVALAAFALGAAALITAAIITALSFIRKAARGLLEKIVKKN